MRQRYLLFLLLFSYCISVKSQKYWQQSVDYKMTVDVDVKTFKYNGQQTLVYTNNSPDTIARCFIIYFTTHLSLEVKWQQEFLVVKILINDLKLI